MKLRQLAEKGIAHYAVPLSIVLVSVIAVTGYAVKSNAASLAQYAATCAINDVPATLASSASMEPSVTVTNTGNANIAPHMISFVATTGGPTTYFQEVKFGSIKPGASATRKLVIHYSPSLATSPAGAASVSSHSDLNYKGTKVYFQCSKDFSII